MVLVLTISLGQYKSVASFDYLDIVGEGGITLMTLIWIFFTLASRPAGRVTNQLFFGLLLMHVSMLLDFLDEFIHYSEPSTWITTIESLPAPIGMVIMSLALFHWHQEQLCINQQLGRTERFFREHKFTDVISGLYSAEYMKQHIRDELNKPQQHQNGFALAMFDIHQFSQFNQQHGFANGDALLREIAQLIKMNVRDQDLVCRYASDRFIVLMPNTQGDIADKIMRQVQSSIAHLAYKLGESSHAVYPKVNCCSHQYVKETSYEKVLDDINQHLAKVKSHQHCAMQFA